MNIKKEQYNEINNQRIEIIGKIKILENNNLIKEYIRLCKKKEQLDNEQYILYKFIKQEEYSSCNHILIKFGNKNNIGCIKCGLKNNILHKKNLSFDEDIMYNYLLNNHINGIETEIKCNLELAKAIYSKLKEIYPNIDEKKLIKYLKNALNDIKTIEVNKKRKISRAKRLSLKPNFNNWEIENIYSTKK